VIVPKTILAIGAHTDDVELGCGGTIARMKACGADVWACIFSQVNPSNPEWPLVSEFRESMSRLGVPPSRQILGYIYPMRRLSYHRQEILENLFELRDTINPDMVILPSPDDLHRDHYTISQEGTRTFKGVTTLAYELPWNNINFRTEGFIGLKQHHVIKKVHALNAYQSQAGKKYMRPEFIEALATTRGVQINMDYAEAFEVVRWVMPVV